MTELPPPPPPPPPNPYQPLDGSDKGTACECGKACADCAWSRKFDRWFVVVMGTLILAWSCYERFANL